MTGTSPLKPHRGKINYQCRENVEFNFYALIMLIVISILKVIFIVVTEGPHSTKRSSTRAEQTALSWNGRWIDAQNQCLLHLVNPLTAGPDYILFFIFFYEHITYQLLNMLKTKRDTNQQDLKTVSFYFVKSEKFSLTWSCESRQRDTTSSGWKFQLNNVAVKRLTKYVVTNFV